MSELEYFLSVENIEISLYAQARQSLLLLTQGNIYDRLRFLNKYLMFLEELSELFGENRSKFMTTGYLVFLKTVAGCRVSRHVVLLSGSIWGPSDHNSNGPEHGFPDTNIYLVFLNFLCFQAYYVV